MNIQYFGQSFFKISTKNQKGEDVIIAIDPFNKDYGLKVPAKFGADIVLVTHDHKDHNNIDLIKGAGDATEPFLITGPGEYEIKDVMIYGIPSFHDEQQGTEHGENTIYLINTENIWLVHLGDLGQKNLSDKQLELIEGADICLIPVGGTFTIDAKTATKIISQIEPRIIIPMHYNLPGLKFKSGKKLDGVDKFVKEIGLKPEEVDKYKIQKKNLPQEKQDLVIIKN
jgi:L-ascorbate metabolism protein UlaG (beta-lactamase superfamily)